MSERIDQDDWVDQDLLTRGEAAGRLATEIEEVTAALPAAEGAERNLLTRRLTALQESHEALLAP